MKKIQLSLIVALAMFGASITAFTGKTDTLVNTWYGQKSDIVPPYDQSYPLTTAQLANKCPISTQHICAVQLDMNGNLIATRKSFNNFTP